MSEPTTDPKRFARKLVSPSAYSRFAWRRIDTLRRSAESMRDARALSRRMPSLRSYERDAQKFRLALQPEYRAYVEGISTEQMAISMELAEFLTWMCRQFRPRRILDAGSGFSSVVLRRWKVSGPDQPLIWSVDTEEEWLARSRKFLKQHSLPADNLATWKEFKKASRDRFDLIFHDLGHTRDLRHSLLPELLERASRHAWVVLDDAHHPWYEQKAKRILREHGYRYWSARAFTQDRFQRYSLLATKV